MVRTKSEKQLKNFINELKQKHSSVKFDDKFDCKQIGFLGTLVYIDKKTNYKFFSLEN